MAAVIGIASAVVGTIGTISQLQYQAAIADANRRQNELNAKAATKAADIDVEDIGTQGRGEAGALVANQGASGISISSPSFGAGIAGFLGRVYESAVRRKDEGNQQAAGYQTKANIEGANASAARAAIPFAIIGGMLNAASSFVGGAMPTMQTASYAGPMAASNLGYGAAPRPRIRPVPPRGR